MACRCSQPFALDTPSLAVLSCVRWPPRRGHELRRVGPLRRPSIDFGRPGGFGRAPLSLLDRNGLAFGLTVPRRAVYTQHSMLLHALALKPVDSSRPSCQRAILGNSAHCRAPHPPPASPPQLAKTLDSFPLR